MRALHHRRREGLSKAIRRTFRCAAAIQRCQVHTARNIMERLPKSLHASVRYVLQQAWELDDPAKAERLLRNLAQRLERHWSGVAGSILEGIDEILTVTRLGFAEGAAALAPLYQHHRECMSTVRRVCRNVKRWRPCLDGDALDRGRHAGSGQRLPTPEGSQPSFQRCAPLWKLATTKTHTASLLTKPSPCAAARF